MSFVEKAIKKMQEQRREGTVRLPEAVFGAVVNTGAHRILDPSAANVPVVPARIVEINQNALRAAGLLPPEHQKRQIAQQYRQIKRPLLANATGRGVPKLADGHLIMMASAMSGEGKTFTSINLAFSLALEKDFRVLLVDADVAKPHISKLFGLEAEPGLLEALKDTSIDVESLVLPTDVANLSVLPAGKPTENATELLASERMRHIVARLGAFPKRIILFDSPPLLLTTESQALAEVTGQIVVVVRAGQTAQQTVLDALSYLGEGKPISLVLNQSVSITPTGSYYYGYGEPLSQGE